MEEAVDVAVLKLRAPKGVLKRKKTPSIYVSGKGLITIDPLELPWDVPLWIIEQLLIKMGKK